MEFDWQAMFLGGPDHPTSTKNRPKLLLVVREIVRPRRSCRSGRSPEACSRSAARSRSANCWVTTAHNGRRCSRRRCSRRVLSGQSDMKGCRPARVASKTTPWRSIGCIDPRGSPAGGAASAPRGIFLRRSTCKRTETQPGRPPEEKPKAPERPRRASSAVPSRAQRRRP